MSETNKMLFTGQQLTEMDAREAAFVADHMRLYKQCAKVEVEKGPYFDDLMCDVQYRSKAEETTALHLCVRRCLANGTQTCRVPKWRGLVERLYVERNGLVITPHPNPLGFSCWKEFRSHAAHVLLDGQHEEMLERVIISRTPHEADARASSSSAPTTVAGQ